MKYLFYRIVACALILALSVQCLPDRLSILSASASTFIEYTETTINEETIEEVRIAERLITPTYIAEQLIYEEGIYECQLTEDILCQAYTIEVNVGVTTLEDIRGQLPANLSDYDINWPKVIGQFAVGTTIILAVGVINHFSKGSTFFVFGSAASIAKDAFIGAVFGSAIGVVFECLLNGKPVSKDVAKYAIEGFADGFMWGAIESVLKITVKNVRRLKSFKLALGESLNILPDGSVYDDAGKLVGKAYYDADGIWHYVDDIAETVTVFDSEGREIATVAGTALPRNTVLGLGDDVCRTDDLGCIYSSNDKLLPGVTYVINGYTYTTDHLGRITKVAFDGLDLSKRSRLPIATSKAKIGADAFKPNDHMGHIIGDMFNGDNTFANIVPMDGHLNLSGYKKVEMTLRQYVIDGKHVKGHIKLTYSGSSIRPDCFTWRYNAGDGWVTVALKNPKPKE